MPVMFWEDLLKLLWVLSDILGMFGEDSHFDHIFQVGLVQPPPVLKNLFSNNGSGKLPWVMVWIGFGYPLWTAFSLPPQLLGATATLLISGSQVEKKMTPT